MLLVEGQTVQIPTPKNIFSCDIYLDRDTPIFATGKSRNQVYIGKFNTTDEIENEMMISQVEAVKVSTGGYRNLSNSLGPD